MSATDVVHAASYTLPGVILLALVVALRAAGGRAAAWEGAPPWARRYYRFSAALLLLVGAGALAMGVALAVAVLRL